MKMTMSRRELADAVVEYLKRRGVAADVSQVLLCFYYSSTGDVKLEPDKNYGGIEVYAQVTNVDLPPRDGPYR